MPSTVTVVSKKELTNSLLSALCWMPSVVAGESSPEYMLPIDPATLCSLLRFSLVCASSTFTFALSDVSGVSYPSVDIGYRVAGANLISSVDDINSVFNALDSVLYMNFNNTDTGNDTGVITVSYLIGK
jgi:hypothetical protein